METDHVVPSNFSKLNNHLCILQRRLISIKKEGLLFTIQIFFSFYIHRRYILITSIVITNVFLLTQNERDDQPVQTKIARKYLDEESSNKKCVTLRGYLPAGIPSKTHFFPRSGHRGLCSDSACSCIGCNSNR
uniref:Uncharacterized protein n=1 Tax=Corethron hystrix TaxID=216773 RepID=A0A7S1BU22_9STRA